MGNSLSKHRAARKQWILGHEVVCHTQQHCLLKRMAHQLEAPRQAGWAKTSGYLNNR